MEAKTVYRRHDPQTMARTPAGALRDCRKALGLTQRAMAKRLGVSRRTLSRWEFGDHHPSMEERVRVVKLLANAPTALVKTLAIAWGLAALDGARAPTEARPLAALDAALDAALLASAEEADLSPRRLRVAMIRMLRAIHGLGVTAGAACAHLERARAT